MQRRNIMILMISLSLVLLLGSSYALLRSSQVGSTPYVINVGTLQVTFEEGKTEKLSLENMYPMSDKEGMSQSKELGFIVKNTGDIEARYNVYLEETSTNPEFKNHIRFISNKDNQGYNEPKTMGYDKYIDLEARLVSEESASYKVKIWLDYDADSTYMDKTFTAKVVVESNQIDIKNTLYTKINNAIKEHPNTTVVEDNITYLSGSNDAVNYNYVWYSGKLWRITSINQDGTIKMITEDNITAIHFGSDYLYEKSAIYEWLNEDFLDTLYNYENIIVPNADWNTSIIVNYQTDAQNILPKDSISKGTVGFLDIHEYYMSYKNTTSDKGFLFKSYYFWFSNRWNDKQYLHTNRGDGSIGSNSNYMAYGDSLRPVINLQKDIIVKGTGNINDPYILIGDKEVGKNKEKLNSRISGEYINFDGNTYRIVGIEDNLSIKLTSVDYLKDPATSTIKNLKFSNTQTSYGTDMELDSVTGYLNITWFNSISDNYKKMLVKGTYYLGTYDSSSNYKSTICKNTNLKIKDCEKIDETWTGYVGLLRVGEMFSAQPTDLKSSPVNTWLISTNSSYYPIVLYNTSYINAFTTAPPTTLYPVRPTITLNKNVIITSGDGMTPSTAYEISLS